MKHGIIWISFIAALALALPLSAQTGAPSGHVDLEARIDRMMEEDPTIVKVEENDDGTYQIYRRVTVTGSRIPQTVEERLLKDGSRAAVAATRSPLSVYTREDFYRTGSNDLADGLQRVDPRIRVNRSAGGQRR